MVTPWAAPYADTPVDATVQLPGSKSMSGRAVVLAALSRCPTVIRSPLRARDTDAMVSAVRALGVRVDDARGDWIVTPTALRGPATLQCDQAGTAARFLPAVAALATGDVVIDGSAQLRARPLGPIPDALRTLGVDVSGSALPLTVHGTGTIRGGAVEIDASRSSQFVSGLLLAAPRFEKGLELRHVGGPLPSGPHVAMTVQMLRAAGADVDDETPAVWRVAPGALNAGEITVEPDLSNAAPFLAAAVVTGGAVTVPAWPHRSVQPGAALPDLLTDLGGSCELTAAGLTVRGSGRIRGIDVDLRDAGELVPVLVAVAALADSPSRFRGIGHLRGHETDRLAALAREVNALGGDVHEGDDGLAVRPRALHGGTVSTYDDHRMATAAAVLGLRVRSVFVENVATTAKTMPGFVGMWAQMLGAEPGGQS